MSQLSIDCYTITELNPGVWNIGDRPTNHPLPTAMVDAYLVTGNQKALLIDAGVSQGDLKKVVEGITSLPVEVLILHGHGDHTGAAMQFDTIYMSPADVDMVKAMSANFPNNPFDSDKTTPIYPGNVLDLGGRKLEILDMAGHTPGSLVALDRENQLLFGSDSVGSGGIWLQIPFTLPLSVFREKLAALIDAVSDLPELVLHSGHRAQNRGPMGMPYLKELLSLTEDILAGKEIGESNPMPGFAGNGLVASRGQMYSFCYDPKNL